MRSVGRAPRYTVTDQGPQFQSAYRDWCRRNDVRPRFGAVGKKGSIAVIERFILSLKSEFLWKIFVPASRTRMASLLAAYQQWYNEHRPNDALGVADRDKARVDGARRVSALK